MKSQCFSPGLVREVFCIEIVTRIQTRSPRMPCINMMRFGRYEEDSVQLVGSLRDGVGVKVEAERAG